MKSKIEILTTEVLYKGWSLLRKFVISYTFNNGRKENQIREIYNSGDGASILLYNTEDEKIILVRQFRLAALVNGHKDGFILETCAGMLDALDPESAILKEIEEETGYKLNKVHKIGEVFASPGAHMEKIHLYVGEYFASMKISDGGGRPDESEEIEVLEVSFSEIKQWMEEGLIQDSKTMILLQYGLLNKLIY